jgi:hypothetical protein
VAPLSGRLVALVLAAGLALLLVRPAGALAAAREVPRQGPLPAGTALPAEINDAVLTHAVRPARAASAGGGPNVRNYSTKDGYKVAVEASAAYAPNPVADQQLVDFLDSRVHGPELGDLSVYVGTPDEIVDLCGGDPSVVACYAIDEQRMYIPGEATQGIPIEYALTHEYGHHIASWRSNSPWDALDWGAKRWASSVRVCTWVRRGLLFPGNQGAHYWDDPGEGFADSYAHLHYPQAPWDYNQLMRPTARSLAALRQDVLHPWDAPRERTFRGRLGPRQAKRSFHIRMTLDGDVELTLKAPRGSVYQVEAETPGFAAGQKLRGGGEFGVEWCRQRSTDVVDVTVRRRAGRGPFALRVSWPG